MLEASGIQEKWKAEIANSVLEEFASLGDSLEKGGINLEFMMLNLELKSLWCFLYMMYRLCSSQLQDRILADKFVGICRQAILLF